MSEACKTKTVKLLELRPAFVEFTSTKGVLRVLRPRDSRTRAQGLIFLCPRCRHDKNNSHFLIFLFDQKNVDVSARPWGRFTVDPWTFEINEELKTKVSVPGNFEELTVHMSMPGGEAHPWLKPSDVACGWEGMVQTGNVTWRPNFRERWRNK